MNQSRELSLVEFHRDFLNEGRFIRWLARLIQIDEFSLAFFNNPFDSPTSFLRMFDHPNRCIYALDPIDEELIFCAWWEPFTNGALMGIWTDKRLREANPRRGFRIVEKAYEFAFAHYDVILGMVVREEILDEHRRFGYTVMERVPGLGNEKGVWLVYLTRDAWMNREIRSIDRSSITAEALERKIG